MSERGSNPRRPTLAQSLRRHQEIVADHDGAGLTFAEIAEKHRVGEKEVREAYARYVEELAPLMAPTASAATVARYLQELQDVRRELRRIATFADNDSARVGALREAVRTMAKEIELRQHLGQLPRDLGHVHVEWQATWVVEQVVSVLERHDVSVDVIRELEEIVAPSDATDSDA